jgi:NAD(P)-dependent dehydrogenase (short-subunit alcohol dehydrogenase family)
MITVVVAGGTGGIGKTIVQALVREDKYNVVVLSRKVSSLHCVLLRYVY